MRKTCLLVIFILALCPFPVPAQAPTSRVSASYFKRANERYAKGDIKGAIADFATVILVDPQFAMAYNNRGVARERLGDTDGAIADFTKAIEVYPQHAQAFGNRCKTRFALRDLED